MSRSGRQIKKVELMVKFDFIVFVLPELNLLLERK